MPLRAKFRKTPSAPSAPSADRHGRPRNWTPCRRRRRRRRRKRIMRFPSFHNGRRPPANVDSGGGCQSRVKDLASSSCSVRVSGSTKETRRKRTKRRTNSRNKAKKKKGNPATTLGTPVRPLPSFLSAAPQTPRRLCKAALAFKISPLCRLRVLRSQ